MGNLQTNPAVQFSNSSDSSLQMGEIKPANISIHGSVAYQNNYMLDGISTNSDLDPAEQTSVTTTRLGASDEQGFYVDSRLIDSVTVYDHNIPVEFGGFTGGVVDAQTRSWSGENHISIFGRMTGSNWSHIITDPNLNVSSSDGDISHPAQFQNEFRKKTYGFNAEWGLTENLGVVVGYSRRESKIPTVQIPTTRVTLIPDNEWGGLQEVITETVPGGTQTQERTSDNFFAKATLYVSPETEANLSFAYSGYTSKAFLSTVADSDYEDQHDGYNLTASFKHAFDNAQWEGSLAYTYMKDKRDSAVDYWSQLDDYSYEPGIGQTLSTSASGGLGDLTSDQSIITAKTKLDFNPIQYMDATHQFTVGAELNLTHASYKRDKNYYRWMAPSMSGYVQNVYTTRWMAGKYTADYNQGALFGQHTLQYKDWTIRTGVRGEYDDFTEDFNMAPRFTAAWDLLGDGDSVLTFGANRYYGRNILTYALYKAQNGGMQNAYWYGSDEVPLEDEDWFDSNDFDGLQDLKTPYDDEFSVAFSQKVADWVGTLAYVHRNGHDGVRSRGITEGAGSDTRFIRQFYNGGESKHDSVIFTLSNVQPLKFASANHYVKFSAAWQQTKSNTAIDEGYSELESGRTINMNKVWYDGDVMDAEDLDATDFNIPVRLDLELTSEWDQWGLTWYNYFHFNAKRSQAIRDDGEYASWYDPEADETTQIRKYSKVRFASTWSWDTKLLYKPDWARGVGISLEVYNVLNNENATDVFVYKGQQYKSYDPGRQFWLQVTYDY
ncbi:MAG: hypothetical protein Q4E62_05895 [Sutterellaceae bacterium]|nr:hypothetical protein [Sutterellaceae bacterium]